MNLTHIKLMAYLLHALYIVQTKTGSLHKLADVMPTVVEKGYNLRRLQRFFAKYVLDLDIIAQMIFSLLPVKTELAEQPMNTVLNPHTAELLGCHAFHR